jgi:hypothetical protein
LETNSLKKYHAFIFKIRYLPLLINLFDVNCHYKLKQQGWRLYMLLS